MREAAHPLPRLLVAPGLARSTFFHHQAGQGAPDWHAKLRARIHEIFTGAKGRYGHRGIHAKLIRIGWQVAKKTVLKLMREENLLCQVRSKRKYSSS